MKRNYKRKIIFTGTIVPLVGLGCFLATLLLWIIGNNIMEFWAKFVFSFIFISIYGWYFVGSFRLKKYQVKISL